MYTTVFVPGYKNSLDGHWQERWHKAFPNSHWVEQKDWDHPNCDDWVEALNTLLQSIDGPILLVTHSLGGSTLAEWSKKYTANIIGAFIVAVPDVQSATLPKDITGYGSPLEAPLPFPSIMLASTNDEYSSLERAEHFANMWGCKLVNLGALGHVNLASNLGDWPEGQSLLEQFVASISQKTA